MAARSDPLIPYWRFMQRGQSASHSVDLGPHPNADTKGTAVLLRAGVTSRCLQTYNRFLKQDSLSTERVSMSEGISVEADITWNLRKS